MGEGLVLCCEVSSAEAVQKLCCSDSNDGYAADCSIDPPAVPLVAIVSEVGHGNGYQSRG